MFTFDLKSGYHYVDIFKDHQKFLSFAWTFYDSTTKFFQFTVLPFGLSSAPYIFTKLLKPLVKYWRSQGKSLAIFLDDGIGAARTYISRKIFSLQTYADLLKFGFLPNESKCVWDPVQEITWLGVSINTSEAKLRLTAQRVDSTLTDIDITFAHKNKKQHVKRFASICGKIISCGSCVGNLTKLMTRRLYALINSAPNWNSKLSITEDVIEELIFWKDNIVKIGTHSVHVGSRKKISELSWVISGFLKVMPYLMLYSVPLCLLHLQICLLVNWLLPTPSHLARSQNGM